MRITSATEHHGHGLLTRVRVESLMSKFCLVLMVGSIVFSGLLLMYVWPFSRPAVLIPLTCWAMYLVNKFRVTQPVLGLIDDAAEKAGYTPIYAKGHQPIKRQSEAEVDWEEQTPSMA